MLNVLCRFPTNLILSHQHFSCCEIFLMSFCHLCPAGESGLGKSTLINSLFLTDLYSPEYPGPSHRIKKTVQVRSASHMVVGFPLHSKIVLMHSQQLDDICFI